MALTKESLETLSLTDLKETAQNLGVKVHYKHSPDKIISLILATIDGEPVESAAEADNDSAPEPSPEEIEAEAIASEGDLLDEAELAHIAAAQNFQADQKAPEAPKATQAFKPDAPLPNGNNYPSVEEAKAALASHIARGLQIVTMTTEYWHLRQSNREAAGNMKMPLKTLLMQANILMVPTKQPTEE